MAARPLVIVPARLPGPARRPQLVPESKPTLLRRLPTLLAIALVGCSALVLTACGGDDEVNVPSGSVASVEGNPIPQREFDHWLSVINASQQGAQPKKKAKLPKRGSPQYEQLARQAMQFIVTSRWIIGEAADRDLTTSDREVARQFQQTKQQSFPSDKAYRKFLRSSGQTQEDIDFRVRADVLANKVRQDVTKDVGSVSNDDIEQYYNANEQQFSQPERRDLRVVVTKDEGKANEALQRIKGGEDFKRVVKQYSTDPATKQQDGQLLGVAQGQQDPALEDAVFKTPQGQPTGPVKTRQGYYVFEVTKITRATKQSIDQAREGIRQLLISQKQQQALDAFTRDFRDKWRGRTDCLEDLVTPDCSNGEEEEAPSAGGGPPAKQGTGSPAALGGSQPAAAAPPTGGLPGAVTPTPQGVPGAGPPAQQGTGAPAALGGVPAENVPGQNAPPAPSGAPPGG